MPSVQMWIRKFEPCGTHTRNIPQRVVAHLLQHETIPNGVGTQEKRGLRVEVADLFHGENHVLVDNGEDVEGPLPDIPGDKEGLLNSLPALFFWKKSDQPNRRG